MTGEQFTQIKRPVSRLTEKVLGWFMLGDVISAYCHYDVYSTCFIQ